MNEFIRFAIIIIMILVIFYIASTQEKKQKQELKKMQEAIKENDKIITYSGLSGTVTEVLEDRIILQTYPENTKVSIEKWAIAGIDERKIDENNKK